MSVTRKGGSTKFLWSRWKTAALCIPGLMGMGKSRARDRAVDEGEGGKHDHLEKGDGRTAFFSAQYQRRLLIPLPGKGKSVRLTRLGSDGDKSIRAAIVKGKKKKRNCQLA